MLGVGLVEAASAENVLDCAVLSSRSEAVRLAARSESICVAEKPTKVTGADFARALPPRLLALLPRLLVRFVAI
jgi:hypothetical protein